MTDRVHPPTQVRVPGKQCLLRRLRRAALDVQTSEDEIDRVTLVEEPLPGGDREVPVLVLEVVAEHRDEPSPAQRRDDLRQISVGLGRNVGCHDMVETEWKRLHPLAVEPRHLQQQTMGHVGTDRGDAVHAECDRALQRSVRSPGLGRSVVPRDVVGDEIEVRRDDALAEVACRGDVAATIDLVRVPDDVGAVVDVIRACDDDLRAVREVLGVRGKLSNAREHDLGDALIARQCSHGRCGEHLRTGLVRAEPGRIDGDTQ